MLSHASSIALRSSGGKALFVKTALRSSSCSASVLVASGPSRRPSKIFSGPLRQPTQTAWFSSDSGSHDDFAPQKKKAVDGEEEALALIKEHVESNRVMLYMKGNPSLPMCGFSAQVVQVLQKEGVDFSSVNVLDYPAIREGVKKYADWPTIPQLYVNGEFIGGCDIIMQMHESGELKEVLEEEEEK